MRDSGTHKVTIKDIAAEAQVSVALVSFVMNNRENRRDTYRVNKDTAKRILEVAERLNYHPNSAARSLRSGRTYSIGVIVSDISNKFFADIARCIEDRANDFNYTVFFGSTDENPDKLKNLIEVFVNKGMDGLVIVPCDGSYDDIRSIAQRIPVVLLDRDVPESDLNCVTLNNLNAGQQAAEALLARGCKRVEMISHTMRLSNFKDREDGYRQAMQRAGVPASTVLIHRVSHKKLDRISNVIVSARNRGVDGLFFATNTLALAGLKEINRFGWRVPGDFRVATFDSSDAFELDMIDIVYIQQPAEQFGKEVVDMMMKAIESRDSAVPITRVVLTPTLVEKWVR